MVKIGDKIAAAVLSYKRAHLRIGVVEKIHPPVGMMKERYTLRDDEGEAHIVSSVRTVALERDAYHSMEELYEFRLVYHAHAVRDWLAKGYPVVKSWNHHDGKAEVGWFIVTAELPSGQVTNHYKAAFWNLFNVPAVEFSPEWDGHTPQQAALRLIEAL